MEAARQHVHLAREIDLHDPLLRRVQHRVEILGSAGEPLIEARHRPFRGRIDKQRQDLVCEIVTGAAGDRPVRQPLVACQYFLDGDVELVARLLAQRGAICGGIEQPVDMVDAQPLHLAALDHREHHAVRRREQLRQFDAQSRQIVDVEKPPVINLLSGNPPVRDAIVLRLQKPVQPAEAGGPSRASGEIAQRHLDRAGDSGITMRRSGQPGFHLTAKPARLGWIEPVQCRQIAGEARDGLTATLQDNRIARRRQRKTVLVIPGAEAALGHIEAQFNLAAFEHRPVLVAEHRQQHAAFQILAERIPIDVEITRIGRGLAPFENIEPPRIVGTPDRHMVGHDVEDEAHAMLLQRRDKRGEFRLAADLRVEPVVIDDVVAVRRSRPRFHQWRRVDVADPELR